MSGAVELEAELREARENRDSHQRVAMAALQRVAAAEAERDTLLAQVGKMRGALEEIATRDVHPYIQIGDDPNECGPTIMIDGQYAKIARAALTKEPS